MSDLDARFWALVESSRRGPSLRSRLRRSGEWARSSANDRTAATLTKALKRLTPEEIAAFDSWMQALLDRAYRADLWAAAYLVNGGCSDDGFEYFLWWLIGRGRKAYEAVLANPDNLAELLASERADDGYYMLEFESLGYCATEAYEQASEGDDLPFREDTPPLQGNGSVEIEDSAAAAKRWPQLGAMVGQ